MQELRRDLDAGAGQNLDARAEVGSQRSAAYQHFSPMTKADVFFYNPRSPAQERTEPSHINY